jgi:hypothetical protein
MKIKENQSRAADFLWLSLFFISKLSLILSAVKQSLNQTIWLESHKAGAQ